MWEYEFTILRSADSYSKLPGLNAFHLLKTLCFSLDCWYSPNRLSSFSLSASWKSLRMQLISFQAISGSLPLHLIALLRFLIKIFLTRPVILSWHYFTLPLHIMRVASLVPNRTNRRQGESVNVIRYDPDQKSISAFETTSKPPNSDWYTAKLNLN